MGVLVQLAGRVRLEGAGTAVEGSRFPGRQGRLAFARLVDAGRAVPRDELAAAVWGDVLPRSWERDLSAVVSKLRALLGPAGVVILGGSAAYELRLPPGSEVDVAVAARGVAGAGAALAAGDPEGAAAGADRALEVLGRELLPGLAGAWVDERREDQRRLLRRGLEVRADARAATGDVAGALADATELVAVDPFRETGHTRLITLELRAGNRAEALRAYERCRRLLAEELGVVPGPDTEAAYVEALRAGRDEGGGAPLQPGTPPFVGRGPELDVLAGALALAASGTTRVVLLVGEAGIGKSRLATEFARSRADGVTVLAGRCDEETVVPYRPFAEALRPLAGASTAGAAIRRVFPDHAEAAAPDGADPQLERYRLFEAVTTLLRRAGAERPVVLLVDDLQWADRASVLLLRHVARSASPPRVLVVATCRDRPVLPAANRAALVDLEREGRLRRVEVGALEVGEVAAMVAGGLPDASPDLAAAVHAATAGNPWFVGELVSHLAAGGTPDASSGEELLRRVGVPRGVEEAVLGNLARLPGDGRLVVSAAAVVGGDLDAGLLARVTGLDEDRVLDALEEAVSARLARPAADGTYRLAHALVREALYASFPPGERLRLHRRVGDALEALHAGQLDAHLGALTRHLAVAAAPGRLGRVVEFSERAGARALASLAYDEAVHHYRAALELLDLQAGPAAATRCRLLLGLADACARAGDVAEARRALEEAARQARASGAGVRLAEAALAYGALLVDDGLEGGAVSAPLVALLEEALAGCPPGDGPWRARLLARLALELYFSPEHDRRQALLDEAEAMARRLGDEGAIAAALTARCYDLLGSPDVARRSTVADELVVRRGPDVRDGALRYKVWDHLEVGDLAAADAAVARVAGDGERRAIASSRWYPMVWAAARALLCGPLDRVEELAAAALEEGQRTRGPNGVLGVYSAQLFGLRLLQRRLAELEPAISAFADASPNRPVWRAALAFSRADAGRLDGARSAFDEVVGGGLGDLPATVDLPPTLTLLAWTCARVGDAARAAELYERTLPWADLYVVVGVTPAVCAGSFHHPLGVLAATAGDGERAEAHLQAAVACNERIGAGPWAALARDRSRFLA